MKTLENIINELNKTTTENNDVAYKSTFDSNLDLFGLMGGMRNNTDDFMKLFVKAYRDDKELAIRNLFYLRDVRGGMGERNNFRKAIEWLAKNEPLSLNSIIELIPEYGRWDDVLVLLDNNLTRQATMSAIRNQLEKDLKSESPSLLAKWLPSVNTSSKETRKKALKIIDDLGINSKSYRKMLTGLRRKIGVLETKLSSKEYDFDYSKVPSQAMHKYSDAFFRNDTYRYQTYLNSLMEGETKINVGTLYPHQIISECFNSYGDTENYKIQLMEEQWKAMERGEANSNTIVVRDGSGSMSGTPLDISTALAILYSEQLNGEFKDRFITFSSEPKLVSLNHCKTLKDKLDIVNEYDDCSNTNIELVYNLIFTSSLNVPEDEQIDRVLIISDMEFDDGWSGGLDIDMSTYDSIKLKYRQAGIKMPEIVFWNVDARSIHFPTTDKDNVKLVSGYSNHVLQDILNDKTKSATDFMLSTLEKYKDVSDKFIQETWQEK